MVIKENITQCLYLTVLITSIMYRSDRTISIRNQTLTAAYLLHLFCEKRFSSLTASRSCGTLSKISEEESSLQLELLQLTVVVVKLACCISNYTLETKVQCNEVIALFVLILASPLNNFYYLAQASNSYWLDILVPMSSFSHWEEKTWFWLRKKGSIWWPYELFSFINFPWVFAI